MCFTRIQAEKLYDTNRDATVTKLIELDSENEKLKLQVAKLSKNSSNSSKPPSSDVVKPDRAKRRRDKKKRKKGGQLGHTKHKRELFLEDEIDIRIDYRLTVCPECHSNELVFLPDEKPRIQQQVEIKENPIEITQHTAFAYWCPKCEKIHYESFPQNVVKEGLFKQRLSCLVSYLKYKCNVSYSNIKMFLADVFGSPLDVTEGYLAKIIQKCARALDSPYHQLLEYLPHEEIVNVDESGHKENGDKYWSWVFRTELYTLFKIDKSRGSDVLIEVLGKEFNGVIGCDYFSAYRKYMRVFNVTLQFCLAHLIRDLKFLAGLKDPETMRYGKKLLSCFKELFRIIHNSEKMSKKKFIVSLEKQKRKIIRIAKYKVPQSNEAQNMARRFRTHGKAFFEFITTPEIEPTNNIAERAIRFIVIYRRVSQGTRSVNGRFACERFWTVIATCAIQGRSAFDFLNKALYAFFNNQSPPSLILNSS
jgi:transposase